LATIDSTMLSPRRAGLTIKAPVGCAGRGVPVAASARCVLNPLLQMPYFSYGKRAIGLATADKMHSMTARSHHQHDAIAKDQF
jgi:hypothetical protein